MGGNAKRESVATGASGGWPVRRLLLVLGAVALLTIVGRQVGSYVPIFTDWVDGLGPWGPVAFMFGYAVAVVALIPAVWFTLAGGALFGILQGTLYAFVAASVGSIGAFLVSRHFARGSIERRLAANDKFAAIDRAVGEHGLWIVFLLRLSPVFPFTLLNYALGLTRVRLADYALASVGMIPGTLLYVYYGKVAGEVVAASGGHGVERGVGGWIVLALGLLATVLVTVQVTRLARRELSAATGEA
jgi:uncharacterized membrane protein YdjX (TVP38/TMEM64 family)